MYAVINLQGCSFLFFTGKKDQKRYASTWHEYGIPLPQEHVNYPSLCHNIVQRDPDNLSIQQNIMLGCYIDDTVLFGT